jgi:hypothetical protein
MAPKKHKGQAAGHGACRSLTPEEIAVIASKCQLPLTPEQKLAKQRSAANLPDMSHMTPWAP